MRPIALGHKNRRHFGSEAAGRDVAALAAVVETFKRNRINVRDHLQSVLSGLNAVIAKWAAELPPMAWQARQNQKPAAPASRNVDQRRDTIFAISASGTVAESATTCVRTATAELHIP
jgi:hypothetical protein